MRFKSHFSEDVFSEYILWWNQIMQPFSWVTSRACESRDTGPALTLAVIKLEYYSIHCIWSTKVNNKCAKQSCWLAFDIKLGEIIISV